MGARSARKDHALESDTPSWPNREIRLFGAGVDSGTYDYFTEATVGKEGASRGDFTSSEDDNVIVQGVASDELALGFLPLAYVEENRERLKVAPVDDGKGDNGAGPIAPSAETVRGGTYQPSRARSSSMLRGRLPTGPRSSSSWRCSSAATTSFAKSATSS